MTCNICNSTIIGYGNNPYPICSKTDYTNKCCDICNEKVIHARIFSMRKENKDIQDLKVGDEIIIFYAKNSNAPIETLNHTNKFLSGIVENIEVSNELDGKLVAFGSWGNYYITDDDSFICI